MAAVPSTPESTCSRQHCWMKSLPARLHHWNARFLRLPRPVRSQAFPDTSNLSTSARRNPWRWRNTLSVGAPKPDRHHRPATVALSLVRVRGQRVAPHLRGSPQARRGKMTTVIPFLEPTQINIGTRQNPQRRNNYAPLGRPDRLAGFVAADRTLSNVDRRINTGLSDCSDHRHEVPDPRVWLRGILSG